MDKQGQCPSANRKSVLTGIIVISDHIVPILTFSISMIDIFGTGYYIIGLLGARTPLKKQPAGPNCNSNFLLAVVVHSVKVVNMPYLQLKKSWLAFKS